MKVKDKIKSIGKYIGLGIVGGLSLINVAKAQSNTEYKKLLNEIVTEGDIIKIPENKLEEFIKNYKPEKKINTLNKRTIQDFIKDGTIIDAYTRQPLQGIEVTMPIFDGATPIDTIGPLTTNTQGYYTTIITVIDDIVQIENIGEIKYQIINTPQIQLNLSKLSKVEIKIYDLLGQEIQTLLDEETKQKTINTNIDNLASGVYILQTIIDGKQYNNKTLKTEKGYNYGKTNDKITKEKTTKNNLEKITENLIITRDIKDPQNNYYEYNRGLIDPTYYENITFNMALPKVVFLPDSMKFTSPEVNYPINTEIRLWQYMARIIDQNDYKSIGKTLMPMKIFDPGTQPQWTQPIINGTNNIRNQTTHNPDSLVQTTNEFKTIAYSNGFSQINIIYADSNLIGQEDHGLLFFYSSTNDAFVGAELYINTSTGMQPIDIYKAIQKDIMGYVSGGINPINNPKYLGTNNRGEPYNITTPEMHIIDIVKTLYDIIKENGGQRIFTNRFMHPQ